MIQAYNTSEIPLEGIWLDYHYMDVENDFSVNKTAFPALKNLSDSLHSNNQKLYVSILAGLSANEKNEYYVNATKEAVLIQSLINLNNTKFHGALTSEVLSNHTVFLDFFNDKSHDIHD
jgi:alpha-glucosidase (family GH31 glycosyl hydrolase)